MNTHELECDRCHQTVWCNCAELHERRAQENMARRARRGPDGIISIARRAGVDPARARRAAG